MTEKEKMLSGKIYDSSDKELAELRTKAHKLSQQYSSLYEDDERRNAILDELLPDHGEGFFLQGPVYFDYGVFTKFGSGCYANFNLTVLGHLPCDDWRQRVFRSQLHHCHTCSPIQMAGA